MPSCNLTGLFPINSPANTEGRRTTFILALCGKDDNVRDVTLWINNLSGMQNRAIEDHACYISGTLLIYNDGPDAIEAPFFVLEASSVEDLGIDAEKMAPTTERLANAHFVGQIVPIADAERREFGLSTGGWSSRDGGQRSFEVRMHFDDDNPRFNNFRMPRIGANVEVEAKWIRDSPDRSHWVIQQISYLGALPANSPATPSTPATSPNRKRLFGAGKTASTSKRVASPAPNVEEGKKRVRFESPAESGPSTHKEDEIMIKEEDEPSPMLNAPTTGEEDTEDAADPKGKGKMKTRSHK